VDGHRSGACGDDFDGKPYLQWHLIGWEAFHVGLWKVKEPIRPPMTDANLVEAATHFHFPQGDCYTRDDCIIDGRPLGLVWEARHQERGVVVVRTRNEAFAFLGVQPGTWIALMKG
jgi:hypothetical protein